MTKLISYAYFKQETDISQNIDESKLDNPIKNAHRQLKFLIGTDFYNQIVSQFPSSFTTDNMSFFDPYVKQFLAWQAYEYYIIKANFAETASGFRVYKEENSDVATDKQMGELIRIAKETSQLYKGEMITFLVTAQNADSTKYPLYTDKCYKSFGTGFHISKISKKDKTNADINKELGFYPIRRNWIP